MGRLSEKERKTLFESIISKDYRNTWVFRPVLLLNGKETDSKPVGILTTELYFVK